MLKQHHTDMNNSRNIPQNKKEYNNSHKAGIGIPIPGKVARRTSPSSHQSMGYLAASSEEFGENLNSISPDAHVLSSSYHGTGCIMGSSSYNAPLNVYGTSPRTSVMFNYYNSPKGSYGHHNHPPLLRAKSTGTAPSAQQLVSMTKRENMQHHESTESLTIAADNSKKTNYCKFQQCYKAKGREIQQLLDQDDDERPRAWSESDKNSTDNSLQNSRVSALRKIKMKFGQKGQLKRQKSIDDEEKAKSGNVSSLERLEEGRQLDCSFVAAKLQGMSLENNFRQYEEYETAKRPTRSVGVVRHTALPILLPQVRENPEDYLVYQRFFEEHTCYDIMPTSSKLVVLDTRLEVKKAFHALIENSSRCAPLWDNELQEYVGLLTVSDFVSILLTYDRCPNKNLEDLENQRISCWRKILNSKKTLIHLPPHASLYDAILSLTSEKIRRLAIVHPDNGDVFHVINYRRILHFLHLFLNELPKPKYMTLSVGELGLATPKKVATVREDDPVIEALKLIDKHKVSGLPVIDAKGHVTNMFTKTDILVLAGEQLFYDLSITVGTVISLHSLEQSEDSSLNRMMPGSPALTRRRNQPREDGHRIDKSVPMKPHPFLKNVDNSPRLMTTALPIHSHSSHRPNSTEKKENFGHQQCHGQRIKYSGSKGDPGVFSPPNTPIHPHRRRNLSGHLQKSTSLSSHLVTVTKYDSLEVVINCIVTADVLQAVVVDDFDHVQGVISIGDILRFMVFPTDEKGKVMKPQHNTEVTHMQYNLSNCRYETSPSEIRLRTASDDSDTTYSFQRNSKASVADSGYSESFLSQTTFHRTSSGEDSSSSSNILLEDSRDSFPAVKAIKSGAKIDRL